MALAAFAVPLLLAVLPGLRIPSVVGEIVAGIALGASGLGLIDRRYAASSRGSWSALAHRPTNFGLRMPQP